jgi:hypothetical protein
MILEEGYKGVDRKASMGWYPTSLTFELGMIGDVAVGAQSSKSEFCEGRWLEHEEITFSGYL